MSPEPWAKLRIQSALRPGSARLHIQHSVVQAIEPPVPEFHSIRNHPEAAPMRGTRHRASSEAFFDLTRSRFECRARGQVRALVRRPCADLASSRARVEVRVRFFTRDPFSTTLDSDLLL